MAAKKVTGTDADGIVHEFYYVGNLHISEIDPDDYHQVLTESLNGETDSQDFVGPRPKK